MRREELKEKMKEIVRKAKRAGIVIKPLALSSIVEEDVQIDERLKEMRITPVVELYQDRFFVQFQGKTFPVKDILKREGFKFYGVWTKVFRYGKGEDKLVDTFAEAVKFCLATMEKIKEVKDED